MLRDRLVVGIRDLSLSEKLQTNPMLTLEKAKTSIRQQAAVKAHPMSFSYTRWAEKLLTLVDLEATGLFRTDLIINLNSSFSGKGKRGYSVQDVGMIIIWQEINVQPLVQFVTNVAIKGHLSAYCFTKPLHAVSTGNTKEKASSFLGTMTEDNKDSWYIDIQMRQRAITFKIDTGAEVTAISGKTHQLIEKPKLANPRKVLYGPINQTLDVMGQLSGCLKYGKHSSQETIYVVKGLKTNLLGVSEITALQLIQRVYATYNQEPDVMKQFPKVFEGLGNLVEAYQIKLEENKTSYSLFVPRNVPIPQYPIGQRSKRNFFEWKMGVISKIITLTPWCAGMVVVPKRLGAVRICVEPHPIPKVDDTFYKDEHDTRLMAVLQQLEKVGVTLNFQKCQFLQESIKFLGHVIDKNGIHADPEKTTAISNMKPPQSISDLRRFMGLVNQLGKFSSRIAEISQPVRELLRSNRAWIWGPDQEKSFSEIK